MKLYDIKAGDIIRTDGGFTCIASGSHAVEKDKNGLFIKCSHGKHYLDGQEDKPGADLIGISRA